VNIQKKKKKKEMESKQKGENQKRQIRLENSEHRFHFGLDTFNDVLGKLILLRHEG
jgi:hypothetical protein